MSAIALPEGVPLARMRKADALKPVISLANAQVHCPHPIPFFATSRQLWGSGSPTGLCAPRRRSYHFLSGPPGDTFTSMISVPRFVCPLAALNQRR